MDLKNRIPCAIMNQGKSMLIDKTSILSQNLGHYQLLGIFDILLYHIFLKQTKASLVHVYDAGSTMPLG